MELFNLTRKSKLPRIHSSDILPLAILCRVVGGGILLTAIGVPLIL
jgi:hypothetical protein